MSLLPNSIEGKAAPYLKRIENVMADMESAKSAYMSECKGFREDIKSILSEAKDNGLPAKALKATIKYRELEKRQRRIGEGLDIDEQSSYEQLVEALGDFATLPLGEAAVDKAKPKTGKGGGKKSGKAANAPAPDPDAVKARTKAELDEPIDEMDKPFGQRHAEQKARDDAAFSGGIGTEPATHSVQ